MPFEHSHGHGHSCSHETTDVDRPLEMGIEYSLYKKIDLQNLECLNEEIEDSGKQIFKPYEDRLDTTRFVRSDVDQELLFNIPFTGIIKLKGIIVIGANDNTHPNKMRLFKNRAKMTFDDTSLKADQEFELSYDNQGEIEYATKIVTFSSVHHLTIHFPSNYGNDITQIYYIGLRGEFSEARGHGVTICTYEARANVTDHDIKSIDKVNQAYINDLDFK